MTKYYALIGPKLDGPALNSAMTACSIEPSIRQVPRLYVNRMHEMGGAVMCAGIGIGSKINLKWEILDCLFFFKLITFR